MVEEGGGEMTNWVSTLLAMCLYCRYLSNRSPELEWLMASKMYVGWTREYTEF